MSGVFNGGDAAKLALWIERTVRMRSCKEAGNHERPRGCGVDLVESEILPSVPII